MKKEFIFRLIGILLPFVLICSIELVLRLVSFGERYQLFHDATTGSDTEFLVMNPGVAHKYFTIPGVHSDNQSDLFLKTKTDSTFRIFVQGASTVAGFPYYHSCSFPRLLKHRLSQTFPDRNIEVINTGITAVSSYTLWDMTNEIIEQQPDLVIIYAGHNEYYGALGVASSNSIGRYPPLIRLQLSLKNLRVMQLASQAYRSMKSAKTPIGRIGKTTLMEVMVKNQQIHYDSPEYHAGLHQFEDNMNRILEKYQQHEIPVIMSTVVSNERDVSPFLSDPLNLEQDVLEMSKNQPDHAQKLAMTNGAAAYQLGRHYLQQANKDSAKKYLHLAKELDLLRFRAPEKLNELIRNSASQHQAFLLDMCKVFLNHSPDGIIGNELLTEHVHPNIMGNYLIADALYHQIREMDILNDWSRYLSFDEALQDLPIAKIDSLKGHFVIADLKNSWPYDLSKSNGKALSVYYEIRNPNYEERKALEIYMRQKEWTEVMLQAYNRYVHERAPEQALKIAQSLILEYPYQSQNYYHAANMALQLGDTTKANYYLYKYQRLK